MLRIVIALSILLLYSCGSEFQKSEFQLVYKNDKEGQTISGSKEALIQYIRGGAEIKIGWGAKGGNHAIEHLCDPIWLSVLDESEVICHLDPQVLSKIDWENSSASYADSTLLNQEWRVVITTKGEFDAIWYDRKNNSLIKRVPQNHTMSWFARGNKNAMPLFSKEVE